MSLPKVKIQIKRSLSKQLRNELSSGGWWGGPAKILYCFITCCFLLHSILNPIFKQSDLKMTK